MPKWFVALTGVVALAAATCGAAAASTGSAVSAVTGSGGAPIIRTSNPGANGLPTISENWSGYAVTAPTKFTYVHSEFIQPAINCPGIRGQDSTNWVGLDGFTSDTVEQDGTNAYCGGSDYTTPIYHAWYEMYPANSFNVFPVTPGDLIEASVSYSSGQFTLTISDLSSGKTHTTTGTCNTCQRSSAEWIIERPAECNDSLTHCFLFALADFKSSIMSGNIASAGGPTMGINGFHNYPIYMVDPLKRGFVSLDSVGPVVASTDSFTTTWDRAGTTTPITLGPRG